MKKTMAALFAAAALTGGAFEVTLTDDAGRPFADTAKADFRMTRTRDAGGVETVRCLLRSKTDERLLLKVVASDRLDGATVVWDGQDEVPKAKAAFTQPLLHDRHFLMGAAWGGGRGLALASGAEDLTSWEDLVSVPDERGIALSVAVHAALIRRGAEYACTFHRIAFSPKYGIRDALARYYPLYPKRFTRDPRILPGTTGICAQYSSWRWPNPESCRFGNATWEWCHGAGRSWGDPLNTELPGGKPNVDYTWDEGLDFSLRDGKMRHLRNTRMSIEEFDATQSARLASGYYCGVANGFYMMALANLSNKIAKRYPDSVATEHPFASNDYQFSTEIFTNPECSWGQEIRRQLAALMKKHDLGAVSFDVSRPASVYRGVRLAEMTNVGWDRYGPGVVRGIGSAKLFEYIRTLPNKMLPGNCAVTVNTKYQHLTDMLYLDLMMTETTPWDHRPPYPLNMRFALGEKGLTLWEGYSPRDFDPNFNQWAQEDKDQLFRDLGRYAEHRSFATGAALPLAFLTEYVGLLSHAFVRANDAGFKPVIGAIADGDHWELARYGLGDRSFLVACNETNAERRVALTVYPDEIKSGIVGGGSAPAYVYAPFFGGPAANIVGGANERVLCRVGPLLTGVLECVGTANGRGGVAAEWSGDFEAIELKLSSRDFSGTVAVRERFDSYVREGGASVRLAPGETKKVRYANTVLCGVTAKIRALKLDDLSAVTVEHADDADSKDMADRIAYFFRALTCPADEKKAKKHVSPVKVVANPSLKTRTVRLGDVEIASADRVEFSRLVRRFLNALNHERYPDYAPDCRMDPAERKYFTFLRY